MSEDQALQYLQQGIAAAKAKRSEEARRLLQNAIRLNPASETAWLWLSSVAKDNHERAFCLKQILQLNPANEMALKGLKALGISPEPEQEAAPKSTVPHPEPQKIAAARAALEPIVREALEQPDPYADLAWKHKTRNRAGERAATLLNVTVRVVPLLILVCLLAGVAFVATTTPGGIALAPTWTPSATPTTTPTPTPGFTPTPSPTPQLTYTPSPTLDPVIPIGDLFAEMTPTPVYPRISSGPLLAAVVHMDQGDYAEVLPTLSSERALTSSNFDPNPYYYEAIALTNLGDTERASRLLDEAVTRLDELRELDRAQAEPLIRAGLAYVYSAMGDYTSSNEEADRALEGDARLQLPYQVMARNALNQNQLDTASDVISEGLRANPGDVNLWILRGDLNLQRGQAAEAQQNAYVALTIDPTAEEAYLLQARADVARGDFGLAVLHLQSYLFIYPGSIQGWTQLGEARTLEGNTDLAIDAYSQALNTEEPLPIQATALRRRAELYMQRHQYALAGNDYGTLLSLNEEDGVAREGRARAAYAAGRYGEAVEDLDVLLETQSDRDDLSLLKARALVEGANPRNEAAYNDALDEAYDLLTASLGGLPQGLLSAIDYEYRARILFTRERYNDALTNIEDALRFAETGSAHYWRGRIQQALGEDEDARREYEWVRMWGQAYSYPFLPDAADRLRSLTPEDAS